MADENVDKSETFAKKLLEQAANEGLTVNELKMALKFVTYDIGNIINAAKISVLL